MSKERTLIELVEERKALIKEMKGLTANAENEARQLDENENARFEEIRAKVENLTSDINKRKNTKTNNSTMSKERASIRRIIASAAGLSTRTEADNKFLELGEKRHSGLTAGGLLIPVESRAALTMTADGGKGISEDVSGAPFLPLEDALVLVKAGASLITGAKGDITFPVFGAANVNWEGETDAAADAAPTIGKKKFTPHRLSGYVDISKQMLIQESFDVEALIEKLLADAIAQKVEKTALSAGSSVADTPDGIFSLTPLHKGAVSWEKVVALEGALPDGVQLGNCAYIGASGLTSKLKTSVKDSSGAGAFIINEGNTGYVNGYKYFSTGNAAKGLNVSSTSTADNTGYGLAFGDWSRFGLVQFGALDLVVDGMTKAVDGQVRVVVNSFWDLGAIDANAFKVSYLK